jgi:hypothetical protein
MGGAMPPFPPHKRPAPPCAQPARLLSALLLTLLLSPLPWASPSGANDIPEWTTNGGQLILQGVPEIPPALVERVKQYQNVRSATFLDWTRNGKGLYIRTNFGDISQVHRVDSPGGSRQQLTWYPEPVGQVLRRLNGDARHHDGRRRR